MGTLVSRKRFGWIAAAVVAVIGLAWGVHAWRSTAPPAPGDTGVQTSGKRIFWIDSYHEGNPWNDGIGRGINQALQGSGVVLQAFHMDTARNAGDAYANDIALKTKAAVDAFKPDVLIATDDAAQKYVVVPF
ncbi:hypothetical protein, partial [Piscinibacter sp.]|uniref:hypothetical protein n=1 Tax=Piscinibacter sp. TaxID=1903157 RepID=UPI002F40734B